MSKENKKDFSDVEYRFSFSLTASDGANNDIIICKRDFNIFNFDEESLYSMELKETIDEVVHLIDKDLKSKSRTYIWYNVPWDIEQINQDGSRHAGVYHGSRLESKDTIEELKNKIDNSFNNTLKFTFFDKGKPVLTKIWSSDAYPFYVRNSIDLTNRKYKNDNVKNIEMDFLKQIAQKASAGKQDLVSFIIRHISSTCGSSFPKYGNKVIYKQSIPGVDFEQVCINDDDTYSYVINKLPKTKTVVDDNGFEKDVYEVYTTNFNVGKKSYNLDVRNQFKSTRK